MFKNFTESYAWKIMCFLAFSCVGIKSIFHPESIHLWFIQAMGLVWIIDAFLKLLEIAAKYLENKIKELEDKP